MANLWQNITGTVKTAFKIGRTNTATLDASGLTASRAQALPDKAGTLVVQLASGKIDGVTNGTATGEALTFDAIGASVQAYSASTTLLGNTVTGTGSIVLATSPTLVTPVLGVAAATSLACPTFTTASGNMTIAPAGVLGLGGAGSSQAVVSIGASHTLTGAVQVGTLLSLTGTAAGTTAIRGFQTSILTTAAAYTCSDLWHYYAASATVGAGSTVTRIGKFVGYRDSNATYNVGLYYGTALTWAGNYGVYIDATVDNYFGGNVGIGTTSPSARVHAISTTEQLRLGYDSSNYLSTTVSSSGAVTFDSVGSGAAFSFSDSVAIGVATPLYPLHVNLSSGDNQLYVSSGTPSSVAGDSYLALGSSRADTGVGHICKIRSVAVSAGKADLAFLTQPSNGVYTERMRVDNAGYVGIGTTVPTSALSVVGVVKMEASSQRRPALTSSNFGYSANFRTLMLGSSSTTYTTADTGAVTLAFGVDVSGNAGGTFTGDGSELLFRNVVHFITPNSGNTNYQKVLSLNDGNVGVGTTLPSAKIHAVSTTEQLRLGYDSSNYYSTTVSSAGAVTFDSVGASAGFTFSDAVTVSTATPLVTFRPTVNNQDCGLKTLDSIGSTSGYMSIVPNTIGINSKFFLYVGGAAAADIKLTVDDDGVTNIKRDASNYVTITPSSVGLITFDAVGSGAGFTFSDAVTAQASLTLGVSSTTTGSLVLCGSGGANTHTIKAAAIPAATNSYVWPSASPTAGQVLTASAPATGVVALSWETNGVGDVVGPASSVTGAASVFSGTTGKLLRASPTVIYHPVASGTEDKVEFGATFKDFRTATDGATVTFDLDLSDQWQVTLAGNRTLAVSNASIGQRITILRYQDATGNRTPTWWSNITWNNGLAPVDDPTASGWSLTELSCEGLDAYSVPKWKEISRSTSAPRRGITTATDGATVTFDLRVSVKQKVTLAGNRTLALTSGSFYVGQMFAIKLTQDATGSRTVTWFGTIKWPGGVTPTLTTTAGKSDWFCFVCTDASGSPTFDCLGMSLNLGA